MAILLNFNRTDDLSVVVFAPNLYFLSLRNIFFLVPTFFLVLIFLSSSN